jgi:hypothetical protein
VTKFATGSQKREEVDSQIVLFLVLLLFLDRFDRENEEGEEQEDEDDLHSGSSLDGYFLIVPFVALESFAILQFC